MNISMRMGLGLLPQVAMRGMGAVTSRASVLLQQTPAVAAAHGIGSWKSIAARATAAPPAAAAGGMGLASLQAAKRAMCTASTVIVPKPMTPYPVSSLGEERRRRERLATLYSDFPVTTLSGEVAGNISLASAVFHQPLRIDILQRVVLWQQAKKRKPTIPVKNRSEVSGGGKKPFQQKGSGRARAGSIRSPLWRGGGKAHGRRAHTWEFSLNKKVRRLGLRVALSARMREGKLTVVEDLEIEETKTSLLNGLLERRGWDNALFISDAFPENFKLAVNNIPNVDILMARGANVYSILKRRELILSKKAVDFLHFHLLRL